MMRLYVNGTLFGRGGRDRDPYVGDFVKSRPLDVTKAYVRTAQGQLHYAEAGEGAPLLLMGETPRGWRTFERLIPLLARDRRVIALDLPGLGDSHPLPEPMSVAAMAACVADFIAALGLQSADVFGMHTGNKVAAALAADRPEQVDRLVLAGQTHSLIPEKDARNAGLGGFAANYAEADDSADGALRAWLRTKLAIDAAWWPEALLAGEADPRAIELAAEKAIDLLRGRRSAAAIYRAVFDFDLAAVVARIPARTLVLEFTTPEEAHFGEQGPRLSALMPDATAASIPVTFLSALERQPEAIAEAVRDFLKDSR